MDEKRDVPQQNGPENDNNEEFKKKNDHEETHKGEHSKNECRECKKLKEEKECLQDEISKMKETISSLDDSYKRKVAEFDNYRKRMIKQCDEAGNEAIRKVVSQIVPIMDDFSRALKDCELNKNFESLYKGLKITSDQIKTLFNNLGIKEIEAVGSEFDPNIHEALLMEEKEDVKYDKTVVEEFEKGYVLGDQLIRHSKVKVAKKKKTEEIK